MTSKRSSATKRAAPAAGRAGRKSSARATPKPKRAGRKSSARAIPKPTETAAIDDDLSPLEWASSLRELTSALIAMLRAGARRDQPDAAVLALINQRTPADLRELLRAWAEHVQTAPAVDDLWLETPRRAARELAGSAIQIGILASGEPVLARPATHARCEVVVIDDEGIATRYQGLEQLLQRQQERAGDDFELARWLAT